MGPRVPRAHTEPQALEAIPSRIAAQDQGVYRSLQFAILERSAQDPRQDQKIYYDTFGIRCGTLPPTRKEESGRCPIEAPRLRTKRRRNETGKGGGVT